MAAIIGKTSVNNSQQTSNVQSKGKTNKIIEKYNITPKQFVGGLLASAGVFAGIAYAIKKKPAKITELLDQAKNLGQKNVDEIKNLGKKATQVADETQKAVNKATEAVQDIADDVAENAGKYKQENLETLNKLGISFDKGAAKQNGKDFTGGFRLKDKNGLPLDMTYDKGKLQFVNEPVLGKSKIYSPAGVNISNYERTHSKTILKNHLGGVTKIEKIADPKRKGIFNVFTTTIDGRGRSTQTVQTIKNVGEMQVLK